MLLNYFKKENTSSFSLIFFLVLAFLTIDVVINQVSDVLKPQNVSPSGIALFVTISIVYAICQYEILKFIDRIDKNVRSRSRVIDIVHKVVKTEQLLMVAILAVIIINMVSFSEYNTVLIMIAVSVSYILTAFLLLIFAHMFFRWYKWDRKSKAVLLFGMAFAVAGFLVAGGLVVEMLHLSVKEAVRTPSSEVVFPDTADERGVLFQTFALITTYSRLTSFVLLLAATVLLIRHYSAKVGRIKFWIILVLPLLYYLGTIIDVLGIYVPETDNDILIFYSLASVNLVGGGILFAIPFRSMALKMRKDDPTKNYLMTAAYGFILFFGLNQITMFVSPYPPYGLAALSISALATYMIFVGIYSTAISMSQNMQLRQSIRRIALGDSNLLSSIGSAQMGGEIYNTVTRMKEVIQTEENKLAEKTGIETNISGEELADYISGIMEDLIRDRKGLNK